MLNILLGLLGLSVVIITHEFGHFLAARALGVEVEAFSVGWGPKLLSIRGKRTEWRISALPIGGFCKMKGEDDYRKAIDEKLETIPRAPGSFYGAPAWKRIVILLSGPAANLLFAFLVFCVVSLAGITFVTAPNRVILASEISAPAAGQAPNPADSAGLMTGDRILSIDGKPVADYSDIQELVGLNPGREMPVEAERDGAIVALKVTPRLDRDTGQGVIGIYPWMDAKIDSVLAGSAADLGGLRSGDVIVSMNGVPIRATIDVAAFLDRKPERIAIGLLRDGSAVTADVVMSYTAGGEGSLGVSFATVRHTEKAASLPNALAMGFRETGNSLSSIAESFRLLFSGVNLLKAVSGPARISYLVGNTASESIRSMGASGIPPILAFLAFLSVNLGIMNLLPIPALDGGQILLGVAEIGKRRPLSTKAIYRYQMIGALLIFLIFAFAMLSDILFFAGK